MSILILDGLLKIFWNSRVKHIREASIEFIRKRMYFSFHRRVTTSKVRRMTKKKGRRGKMEWKVEKRSRRINHAKSRDKKGEFQQACQRVTILPSLYKLRHAQHLHWWREYNISPEARKLSFSPQPQWPLTTCCLSIYILDAVRTSSPYVSS